jgi:hypothetical protein
VPGVAKGWSEDLTPENIRIFLGRIVQEPLPMTAIDAALEGFEAGPQECWYVGSEQTKELADHPDVTGSIIAQTPYGADQVEVRITSRGRRSTLFITPAPDADTVAALRRPFAPERKKIVPIAGDVGDLTAQPFHRDWLLDRFNQAVLIRYPNGVLWHPFRQGVKPIWIAISEGKTLLGIQPQTGGQLGILLGVGDTQAELVVVDLSGNSAKIITQEAGYFDTKIGPPSPRAMGNLHIVLGGQCLLVAADGTTHNFKRDGFSGAPETDDRAVFSDGIYLIERNKGALRVKNPRRGTLARVPLTSAQRDLLEKPRRMVFSPDTKAITFTTDAVQHTVLIGLDIVQFELKDLTLLHFHSTDKALAWDAAENSLVPFRLLNGSPQLSRGQAIKTRITGTPRYCPLTQTVLAMNVDDTGAPAYFVPLDTKRGWQGAEAFDLPDAVERAETLWL